MSQAGLKGVPGQRSIYVKSLVHVFLTFPQICRPLSIRFTDLRNHTAGRDYVKATFLYINVYFFFRCWSYIGRQGGKQQVGFSHYLCSYFYVHAGIFSTLLVEHCARTKYFNSK